MDSDATLLRRSRRDPDAFVEVCRRHSASLADWLGARLRDDTLAQEVLAETLSEAWFARSRYRDPGDGDAGRGSSASRATSCARLYRERAIERRARLRLGLPVPEADGAAEILDRLDAEQHVFVLDALPDDQREALELRVYDDLDYGEIGERLNLTPEGARTRVFRALGALRTQIGRSGT